MTEPARGRGVRTFAMVGARGVLGLLGVGVAAVSVAAATWLPLPTVGTGAQSTAVIPVAATQQRICAGPILRLGDETGLEATTAVSVGTASVTSTSTEGTPRLEDMDSTQNESNNPSQRLLLDPGPEGTAPGILAGSQSQFVESNEYVGFAASECRKSSSDTWLVGGSTTTGRTTLLALSNPSKVSSTVSVEIFSENGGEETSGTEGIVVPPGGQKVLSLAGFAPGIASPVVHVVSKGGQVTASLQQSIVRTLTPGGVDTFGATTRPSIFNVIPGVVISDQESVTASGGLNGYDDTAAVLRVFIPGTESTEVTVTAIPEGDASPPTTTTLEVDEGVVTDIPLGNFAEGVWTFTIASDTPAVVAARTTAVTLDGDPAEVVTNGEDPIITNTDFAWFVAAPDLSGTALVSVADGPNSVLHLVNTGPVDAVVTVDADEGAGTTVTVAAGRATALPVAAGLSYTLGGFDSLRASVSYHDVGQLSGFVVSPPERASQPVTVFYRFG